MEAAAHWNSWTLLPFGLVGQASGAGRQLRGYGCRQAKQTKGSEENEWKWKKANEWSKLNLLERQFMNVMNEWSGEIDCLRNGKPSASAVSEINQFFFCGPAVRPQKEDEIDWGAMCWPQAVARSAMKEQLIQHFFSFFSCRRNQLIKLIELLLLKKWRN